MGSGRRRRNKPRASSALKTGPPSSPYRFDKKAADAAVEFIEALLRHWKGEWAGQLFILQPWQKKIIREVFGWKRRADGTRRYRYVYVEIPKKNGKTFLAAAIALLGLFWDREPGAEIYSAAGDRKQAELVFADAKNMIVQSGPLSERSTIYRNSIVYPGTRSRYQAISAEAYTKHGINPHMIVFDELHAQPNRELWDTLVYGIAARRQPLVVAITTAGVFDPEAIGWEQHDYARKVIDGVIDDPSFYAVIYAAEKDDDWTDPETWKKANPCLGVTLKESYLGEECKRAQEVPAKQNAFKRLHLNIWTQQAERVIPIEQWDACSAPAFPSGEEWRVSECFIGLDLSSRQDITAAVLVGVHPNMWTAKDGTTHDAYSLLPFFWIPTDDLADRVRRDRVPYDRWIEAGYIFGTDGATVDQKAVRRHLNSLGEKYPIIEIGFDDWNATPLASALMEEDGFTIVAMRQGFKTLSEPTKAFLGYLADGRILHGGNPVMRWMADNFEIRRDVNDNWAPKKPTRGKSGGHRIDGIVATVMGLGRAIAHRSEVPPAIHLL